MPDTRKHRGPHPSDSRLFDAEQQPVIRRAVAHYSWLLTRGYPVESTLKLVGDRFQLTDRQRQGVRRSSCSDQARSARLERMLTPGRLAGRVVEIDGFNVLTTIEAALSGSVILRGRDGCDRDLCSMHGSYRRVDETRPALVLLGETLAELQVAGCRWLLDRPVSNSGRLSAMIRDLATERNWNWLAELVDDPDPLLGRSTEVVATADSVILDQCREWCNLVREVIDGRIPEARIIRLDVAAEPGTAR